MPLQVEDSHTDKHSSAQDVPPQTLGCSLALHTTPLEQEGQVVQKAFL